jgi:hypothetical protein
VAIFVTNVVEVDGGFAPDLPAGTTWVGNRYSKNAGAVSKYVIKTNTDITGEPGVFGPITQDQIQAYLDGELDAVLHGWSVDAFQGNALDGIT